MLEVEHEQYDQDGFSIDHHVDCNENNAIACDIIVPNELVSTPEQGLFGAPIGCSPPKPPEKLVTCCQV